jgi:hypothetical protein
MRILRRVVVWLCVVCGSFGCGGSSSGSGGSTRSSASAPVISNLVVSKGAFLLTFQMRYADPEGDLVGGTCNITAPGFVNGSGVIVAGAGVQPNATTGTITCSLAVPTGLTGTPFSGFISVSDVQGNTSNQLTFDTTLPERRAGSS